MPTINSRGQVIERLDDSDPFFRFAQKLRRLKYPQDAEAIKHLPYDHFCYWLYGMDPKEALFLTNDRHFRVIQERMRDKNWVERLYDWIWRASHGLNFSIR